MPICARALGRADFRSVTPFTCVSVGPNQRGGQAIPNRTDLIWVLLPIAPLLLGFAVLGLLDGGGAVLDTHLPAPETFHGADLNLRFFNALVIYAGVGVFHVCACIAVAGLMLWHLWQRPKAARMRALAVLGCAMVLLIVGNIAVRVDGNTGALTLAYRNVCTVVHAADVFSHLMPPSCTAPGVSLFAWMALLPYIFGVIAAAFAAALVSTTARPLPTDAPQEALASRARLIEIAFQATAFVLVTSTVTMMQFYQLPLALIAPFQGETAAPAATLMAGYGNGMTFFWGVLFTLTLAAIFAPAHLLLTRQAKVHALDAALPPTLDAGALRKRLTTGLTTLAPLLIGASGSILEQFASAL